MVRTGAGGPARRRPGGAPAYWAAHRARLSAPRPGEDTSAWLARSDDEVVGAGELSLPLLDNTDNALVEIVVAPGHRGRGVGRRLLAHLADAARQAGRVRLISEIRTPLDGTSPGAEFAVSAGAHQALSEVRRRLRLPADDGELARLTEQAAAASAGYHLLQWSDATPPEWLDDIARLTARMSTDAPLGDLHWAPEHHDAQRVQARDARRRTCEVDTVVTAARAADGTLVAFTEICTPASAEWHAWTGDTIVQAEHRGHRLGLRVKLANLALARRRWPQVRCIDTYNAASNSHMIAINEAIGFRPYDRLGEWELAL